MVTFGRACGIASARMISSILRGVRAPASGEQCRYFFHLPDFFQLPAINLVISLRALPSARENQSSVDKLRECFFDKGRVRLDGLPQQPPPDYSFQRILSIRVFS